MEYYNGDRIIQGLADIANKQIHKQTQTLSAGSSLAT